MRTQTKLILFFIISVYVKVSVNLLINNVYHQLLLPVLSVLLLDTYKVSSAHQPARITCYFHRSAVYASSLGRYGVEDIPAHLCTHIVYGYIGVNDTNWDVLILDSKYDMIENGFNKFTQLRQKHPNLKLQIGVGGWYEDGKKYSQMVAVRDRRQTFIRSLVDFMKKYGFNGLDLNWVYPGVTSTEGTSADKDNFLYFVEELRRSVDREKQGWEISMTAPLEEELINNGYHVIDLCELLDAVNTMGFNLHGPWEDFLDVHSPLYKRKHDKHPYEKSNVNDGLMLWEKNGCPPSKLILGITFYARTYGIDNSITSHSIGTIRNKTMGSGPPGPYTKSEGFLAYYEICTEIMAPWKGLKVGWDDVSMVPYAYNDTLWGGYENGRSIQIKMNYLKRNHYGGAMAWEIHLDDFKGLCGTKNMLLKKIFDNMKNYRVPNEMPNTLIIAQPVTSPSPVVQASDKTPTVKPEPNPITCTNSIVVPHTDPQKYTRCVDGKLIEFECKECEECIEKYLRTHGKS